MARTLSKNLLSPEAAARRSVLRSSMPAEAFYQDPLLGMLLGGKFRPSATEERDAGSAGIPAQCRGRARCERTRVECRGG